MTEKKKQLEAKNLKPDNETQAYMVVMEANPKIPVGPSVRTPGLEEKFLYEHDPINNAIRKITGHLPRPTH